MEINLSEIQIIPVKPRNGLIAFCTFIISDSFYVGDVAIYSRLTGGYRLVYPIKVLPNGAKINCFYPINHKSAQAIEEQIIKAFINLIEKVRKTNGKQEEFKQSS
jgi:DNA-binding cell septation regulator SpoVG